MQNSSNIETRHQLSTGIFSAQCIHYSNNKLLRVANKCLPPKCSKLVEKAQKSDFWIKTFAMETNQSKILQNMQETVKKWNRHFYKFFKTIYFMSMSFCLYIFCVKTIFEKSGENCQLIRFCFIWNKAKKTTKQESRTTKLTWDPSIMIIFVVTCSKFEEYSAIL